MATLVELVKFKNDLKNTIDQLTLSAEVADRLGLVDTIRCRHTLTEYDHYIDRFVDEYRQLLAKNNSIVDVIKQSITNIDADIQQQVDGIDFSQFVEEDIPFYLSTNDDIESIIQTRIGAYSNWKIPGLQLHCRYIGTQARNYATANFRTNVMAACDPLYFASYNKNNLIDMLAAGYADEYQRRVRMYEVSNRDLSVLPQAQFGLVLCWDFLNYLPMEAVKWYLDACIRLLRPGGVLVFSYNNCDLERSAQLVDEKQACWATKTLIENLAVSLGYELITTTDLKTSDELTTWVSWAEIRRPGVVRTVKRSQAMGAILSK
jgi:SAM-dependent methyltransferase